MEISLKQIRTEQARRSLLSFTEYTFPGYQTNWHHALIAKKIDEWLAGKCKNLMVLCPPRHGKSELVSRRLPAFILGRHPDAEIICASYADSLAKRMNRDVQRIIDYPLYRDIFPDTQMSGRNVRADARGPLRNSDIFEIVGNVGSYRGCGIGGGISGMGAHYGIIDDPIKDSAQAQSKTYRERAWDWYVSTFSSRIERMPDGTGGNKLLTLTPWHEDDLRGRILKTEGGEWEVVALPALLENENPDDPRKAGDALWPEKKNKKELHEIRRVLGSYWWSSLYQANPRPLDGNIVNMRWFQRFGTVPKFRDMIVQSWDTAQKASDLANYSVCTTWIIHGMKKYLVDVHRGKYEYPALKRTALSLAEKWNPQAVLIEDKSSGSSLIQDIRSVVPVIPIHPNTDKITRMATETPQIEAGTVYLPETAGWLPEFEAEISGFPVSENDDQVDSVSQFLRWCRSRPGPVKYETVDETLNTRGF